MFNVEKRGGNEYIVFKDGVAIASFVESKDAYDYVGRKQKED